jgi:MinD-like ATPase involved in chromosome partitioning or flagellar assembly
MIYTFYSFKGGVGRSMGLANIAELLYARGLKVLMVDFDLEAPGLERFFNVPKAATRPNDILSRRGIIDMLLSYSELNSLRRFGPSEDATSTAGIRSETSFHPVEPLREFITPIYQKSSLGGELYIITAGRRDGPEFTAYAHRIRSFDWDDFYENHDGEAFFEWFRREAEAVADVVLIDSRTGVSEMSGACTYLLPDTVILFVAPNQQNLDGTAMMADSLSNPKLIEARGRPLSLLFVPSRVEHGELKLFDEFARRFKNLFDDRAAGRALDGASFDDLKLIYLPYFSYMEKVAVREPESAGASDMIKAYEKIASALARLEPEDGPLRKSFHPAVVEKRAQLFISYIRAADDERLAREIYGELSRTHEVFFDQSLTVGVAWGTVIGEKLAQADFLIALISSSAVRSDMFVAEIEQAHNLATSRGGRPIILPVRVNYTEPLPYPLSAYLDHIQFAYWRNSGDTAQIVKALGEAVSSSELIGRSQLTAAKGLYACESSLFRASPKFATRDIRGCGRPPIGILRDPINRRDRPDGNKPAGRDDYDQGTGANGEKLSSDSDGRCRHKGW